MPVTVYTPMSHSSFLSNTPECGRLTSGDNSKHNAIHPLNVGRAKIILALAFVFPTVI